MKADYMHIRLAEALKNIIWKLNRKEESERGHYTWALVDIHDITIRNAQTTLDSYHIQTEED